MLTLIEFIEKEATDFLYSLEDVKNGNDLPTELLKAYGWYKIGFEDGRKPKKYDLKTHQRNSDEEYFGGC